MGLSLPILTFHALDDRVSVISCAPQVFREGMALLHSHGYRTVRLEEAVIALRHGRPFPARSFVVTFDDGYQSVYEAAFPVLQRYGMSATVFLAVGATPVPRSDGRLPSLEGRPMLSWPEIREMHQGGVAFGAHTLTHPDLTQLPAEAIRAEMAASKDCIENGLGTPVTSFAYPFGRYDARSHRMAQQYFNCACADTLGLLSARSDPYALERVDAYYVRTRRLFALTISDLFPWYVRARNVPRQFRRSIRHWWRTRRTRATPRRGGAGPRWTG